MVSQLRKRKLAFLSALVLFLLCLGLGGCGPETQEIDAAAPYKGTWYFAKNGVACQFDQEKIYRDDKNDPSGHALAGIYRLAGNHIDANLADTGGVDQVRSLYIVGAGAEEVLCDAPDGTGTVYFYRDPLTALAALEEAKGEAAPSPAAPPEDPGLAPTTGPTPEQVLTLEPTDLGEEPPASRSTAVPAPDPDPEPTAQDKTNSGTVWIPQSGSKYHSTPSCSGMKNPKKVTLSEAQRKGYTPCKRCH